jgi:hypothetical protein
LLLFKLFILIYLSLGLAYIDAIEAMKFVLASHNSPNRPDFHSAESSTDITTTIDLSDIKDPIVALKLELARSLTVLVNGEKKKGKIDDTPIDLKTINWTPALANAVPSELVRRCAKAKLTEDFLCIRCGYVVDLWFTHIKSCDDVFEITGAAPPRSARGFVSQFSLDDVSVGSDVDVYPSPAKPSPPDRKPQLFIELQVLSIFLLILHLTLPPPFFVSIFLK